MELRKVPLLRPYVSDRAVAMVEEALRSGWIGQGPRVAEFEASVARLVQAPHTVAVSTSAAGVRLALAIAGVGPEDEVVTTALACQATNTPILEQYAQPVFADVQPGTGNIDPLDVERRITARTRAILCVHWGGYPCDLDELHRVAELHDVPLIADASEAFGATYHGRPVAASPRFTVFSFQAVQMITTAEGGMLALQRSDDEGAARRRRWFGIDRQHRRPSSNGYYEFDTSEVGYGYHMTDVQASMGLAHLEDLDSLLERRRAIAARYRSELKGVSGVTLLEQSDDRSSSWGLFTLHVERRDDFYQAMRGRGVDVSVVHVRNDQYSVFGGRRDDLPNLDCFERSYVCIPMYDQLTDDDVEHVISCIQQGW